MKLDWGYGAVCDGWMRAAVAVGLCVLLVQQPLLAAGMAKRKPAATADGAQIRGKQIEGEQRVLHALNRLTFGPRPGDVEAVQAMGLQRWFEWQLNPAAIDDSALEKKLAMFPAMKMQQAELVERYPSPQVLREIIRTNEPLPRDPVEHAIYADQIAFYKAAKAKQEAAGIATATPRADGTEEAVGGMARASDVGPVKRGGRAGEEEFGEGNKKRPADDGSMAMEAGKSGLGGDNFELAGPGLAAHEERFYSGLESVKIINLPPDVRVNRILAMQPEELVAFRRSLSRSELVAAGEGLNPLQKETLAALQGSPRLIGAEVLESRLLRDIYSDRQLEAVMTDFWLNHFNVYVKKNQNEPFLLPAFERDVVRPHALGKFEDLLVATAKSPAMLMYLDNWQSVGPDSMAARNGGKYAQFAKNPQVKEALKDRGLNENYARELMELHTVGVQCEESQDHPASSLSAACGKGYTQQDVTNVAKVLTGWTMDRPFRGGDYRFEERRHEPGSKTVLGATLREDGEREGLQVLHMLATSPATAQFISTKLAVRFVGDTPPATLVDRMAKAFLESGGDIKTVLRTMFDSPEFWAPEVYRGKVKTPLEFVVSAVRASDADVVNALALVQSLDRLGMPLYGMQTPNGYNWTAEPWVSTSALVSRMNFALALSGNRLAGTSTDWARLLGANGPGMRPASMSTREAGSDAIAQPKEKKLEGLLLGEPVSDRTRDTVLKQFESSPVQQQAAKEFAITHPNKAIDPEMMSRPKDRPKVVAVDRQAQGMAGLLIGSPEFQKR